MAIENDELSRVIGAKVAGAQEEVIERAVWGMLPHNNLGKAMLKKLKVYGGAEHPHAVQKPSVLK